MAIQLTFTTKWHITQEEQYVGIPICPGSYFNSNNLSIRVDWGDGEESIITETGADVKSTGRTLFHKYEQSYNNPKTIKIYGGYGADDASRKLAFPKFEDRTPRNSMHKLERITSWENFWVHGQGDFKDCVSLIYLPKTGMKWLLSTDPVSEIKYNSNGQFMLNSTLENTPVFNANIDDWGESGGPNIMKRCISMNSTFKNSGFGKWLGKWKKTQNVTSFESTFEGSNFNHGSLSRWQFHSAVTTKNMFKDCPFDQFCADWFKPSKAPAGGFVIENMSGMFSGTCETGKNANKRARMMSRWDMQTVKDVSDMFRDNEHFDAFLGDWFKNTGSKTFVIENMSGMFAGASKFGSSNAAGGARKISKWKMDTVVNIDNMFQGNQFFDYTLKDWFKPANKPAGGFPVKSMSGMFEGSVYGRNSARLASDIKDWDMSKVEDVSNMFKDASHWDYNLSNWFKAANKPAGGFAVKNMSGMFSGTCKLGNGFNRKGYDIKLWEMESVEDTSDMFKDNAYFDYQLKPWFSDNTKTYSIKNISGMFSGASIFGKANAQSGNRATALIKDWQLQTVENASNLFKDNKHFKGSINSMFISSKGPFAVTDMSGMFEGSVYNKPLGWQMKSVENVSRMFANNDSFNQSIKSWFNTNAKAWKLKNTSGMFEGNTKFNSAIDEWTLPNVEDMSRMFKDNTAFNKSINNILKTEPNNGSFKIKNMESMFENSVYNQKLTDWKLATVESTKNMFKNSSFDKSIVGWFRDDNNDRNLQIKDMSGMFSGAAAQFGSTSQNQNLSRWRMDNVEVITDMFKDNASWSHNLKPWNSANILSYSGYRDNTSSDWATNKGITLPDDRAENLDDVTVNFDLATEHNKTINLKPSGGNLGNSKLLVTYQTDVPDAPGYVSVTQPTGGTVELILNNVEDGDSTSSLDSNIDVIFTPDYNTATTGNITYTVTIIDPNGAPITCTITLTVADTQPTDPPTVASLTVEPQGFAADGTATHDFGTVDFGEAPAPVTMKFTTENVVRMRVGVMPDQPMESEFKVYHENGSEIAWDSDAVTWDDIANGETLTIEPATQNINSSGFKVNSLILYLELEPGTTFPPHVGGTGTFHWSETGIANTYSVQATFTMRVNEAVAASDVVVTVENGKYLFNGVQGATIPEFVRGEWLVFDQSHASNANHPLRFSTTPDGTHGGGNELNENGIEYEKSGTPGTAGAYTRLKIFDDPEEPSEYQNIIDSLSETGLYYYCANHPNMGATGVAQFVPTQIEFRWHDVVVSGPSEDENLTVLQVRNYLPPTHSSWANIDRSSWRTVYGYAGSTSMTPDLDNAVWPPVAVHLNYGVHYPLDWPADPDNANGTSSAGTLEIDEGDINHIMYNPGTQTAGEDVYEWYDEANPNNNMLYIFAGDQSNNVVNSDSAQILTDWPVVTRTAPDGGGAPTPGAQTSVTGTGSVTGDLAKQHVVAPDWSGTVYGELQFVDDTHGANWANSSDGEQYGAWSVSDVTSDSTGSAYANVSYDYERGMVRYSFNTDDYASYRGNGSFKITWYNDRSLDLQQRDMNGDFSEGEYAVFDNGVFYIQSYESGAAYNLTLTGDGVKTVNELLNEAAQAIGASSEEFEQWANEEQNQGEDPDTGNSIVTYVPTAGEVIQLTGGTDPGMTTEQYDQAYNEINTVIINLSIADATDGGTAEATGDVDVNWTTVDGDFNGQVYFNDPDGVMKLDDYENFTWSAAGSITKPGTTSKGTFSLLTNNQNDVGRYTYTPATDQGDYVDQFQITWYDDLGFLNTTDIRITIVGPGDSAGSITGDLSKTIARDWQDDGFSAGSTGVITGTVSYDDADMSGIPNNFSVSQQPAGGTASMPNYSTWQYYPNSNVAGTGSGDFTDSFEIQFLDDNGNATTATVNITIQEMVGGNEPRITGGNTATVQGWSYGHPVYGSTYGTGGSLEYENLDAGINSISTTGNGPQKGSFSSYGGNSWQYTPNDNESGEDSFEVEAQGMNYGEYGYEYVTLTTTITITISPIPEIQDDPGSAEDSAWSKDGNNHIIVSVNAGETVSGYLTYTDTNGVDNGGDPESIVTPPTLGNFNQYGWGSWDYTANSDASGTDTIVVSWSDDLGNTNQTTFKITVVSTADQAAVITGHTSDGPFYTWNQYSPVKNTKATGSFQLSDGNGLTQNQSIYDDIGVQYTVTQVDNNTWTVNWEYNISNNETGTKTSTFYWTDDQMHQGESSITFEIVRPDPQTVVPKTDGYERSPAAVYALNNQDYPYKPEMGFHPDAPGMAGSDYLHEFESAGGVSGISFWDPDTNSVIDPPLGLEITYTQLDPSLPRASNGVPRYVLEIKLGNAEQFDTSNPVGWGELSGRYFFDSASRSMEINVFDAFGRSVGRSPLYRWKLSGPPWTWSRVEVPGTDASTVRAGFTLWKYVDTPGTMSFDQPLDADGTSALTSGQPPAGFTGNVWDDQYGQQIQALDDGINAVKLFHPAPGGSGITARLILTDESGVSSAHQSTVTVTDIPTDADGNPIIEVISNVWNYDGLIQTVLEMKDTMYSTAGDTGVFNVKWYDDRGNENIHQVAFEISALPNVAGTVDTEGLISETGEVTVNNDGTLVLTSGDDFILTVGVNEANGTGPATITTPPTVTGATATVIEGNGGYIVTYIPTNDVALWGEDSITFSWQDGDGNVNDPVTVKFIQTTHPDAEDNTGGGSKAGYYMFDSNGSWLASTNTYMHLNDDGVNEPHYFRFSAIRPLQDLTDLQPDGDTTWKYDRTSPSWMNLNYNQQNSPYSSDLSVMEGETITGTFVIYDADGLPNGALVYDQPAQGTLTITEDTYASSDPIPTGFNGIAAAGEQNADGTYADINGGNPLLGELAGNQHRLPDGRVISTLESNLPPAGQAWEPNMRIYNWSYTAPATLANPNNAPVLLSDGVMATVRFAHRYSSDAIIVTPVELYITINTIASRGLSLEYNGTITEAELPTHDGTATIVSDGTTSHVNITGFNTIGAQSDMQNSTKMAGAMKLFKIHSFGRYPGRGPNNGYVDYSWAFAGCTNLQIIPELFYPGLYDATGMFAGCTSLSYANVYNWDMSRCASIAYMFWGCTELHTLNGLNQWNTSNVQAAQYAFTSTKLTFNPG